MKPIGKLFDLQMFHYQHSVLRFCETLHMFCNGSMEYYESFEPFYIKTYLQAKIDNWQPTPDVFDMLVKNLILQTLTEYNDCCWTPTLEDAKECYDKNPSYWYKEIQELYVCPPPSEARK
jgi:hypothetical protein